MKAYQLLLIESDEDSLRVFNRSLKLYFPEIEIDIARSADDARTKLQENEYHIIVCDIYMGREDRLSFTRDLCQQMPSIPLLVLTADPEVSKASLPPESESCVRAIFYKPLNLHQLVATVNRILETIKDH